MKSKVLIGLIVSYILVLIVPIVFFGSLIYGRFVNILTDEVVESTNGMLCQVRDVIDIRLQELDNLSTQISLNPKIQKLLHSKDIENVSNYPDFFDAIQELRNYQATNMMLNNIFILFKDSNIVISNESKYQYDTVFSQIFTWTGIDSNELYKQLNALDESYIKYSSEFYVNKNMYNVITYFQPMPKGGTSYKAVLFVTIDENMIQQIAKKVIGEYSGSIYILDAQNNIISSVNPNTRLMENETVKTLISSLKNKSSNVFTADKEDFIISNVDSNISDWRYISIIPSYHILNKVNYVKEMFAVIALTSVLTGLIIAFYFSRRNYGKIKKIMDYIKGDSNTAYKTTIPQELKNEWDFINNAIENYISENSSLQYKLEEQIPVMRNSFFIRLFKGSFSDPNQINSMLELLNLKIDRGPFAVILLNLDSCRQLSFYSLELVQKDVLRVTVLNAAEKLCSQAGRGYAVDMDSERVAVLFCMEQDVDFNYSDNNTKLRKVGSEICKFVRETFGFSATAGISSLYNELSLTCRAYAEASTALDYRIVKGENTAICFSDISGRIDNRYYYTFDHEKQLMVHIRMGDYEAIRITMKEIVEAIKNEPVSLDMVKCVYFEIVNTALKAVNELGMDNEEAQYRLPSLVKIKTIDEMYEEVCKFYFHICEQVKKAKNFKSTELFDNVIAYLNDNYADKMLSAENLADRFSVSSSYMSRIFKDQAGKGLIEYLHKLRLRKAKELLSFTDKTVAAIADEAGYNSLYNFTRVFKRYENITPTEYRISERTGRVSSF